MSIKQIAEKAGLSKATVSMILNKKESPLSFSDKTKNKVWEIARQLHYQPNHMAKSLILGKSFCIGVAGTGNLHDMDNVNITRIYSGSGDVIEEHQYNMMILPLDSDNVESLFVKLVRSRIVDGIILQVYSLVQESFSRTIAPFLHQERIPFVAIHSTSQPLACHNVGFDAVRAGYLATSHLLEQGIGAVGIIGYKNHRYNEELFAGYQAALKDRGAACHDARITVGDYDDTAEHGYAYGKKLLAQGGPCEGYVVFSDYFAYGLIDALQEGGHRVPDDVLVAACDNSFKPAYFRSKLTSIDRQFEQRGQKAAEFLFAVLDGQWPDSAGHQNFIAQPELVIRQTSIRPQRV